MFFCRCLICCLHVPQEQIVWLFVCRVVCQSIYKPTDGPRVNNTFTLYHIYIGETFTRDQNQTIKGETKDETTRTSGKLLEFNALSSAA